jgi:hypothetical protein
MKLKHIVIYGLIAVMLVLAFTACDELFGNKDDDGDTIELALWIYDDTAHVSGYQDKDKISGTVVIPSTYKGYPVTRIDDRAFIGCTKLTSITIPASVTRIGDWAFEDCTDLTTVNIAEDSQLQYIGRSAFYGCASLISITIPAGVTEIGFYTGLGDEGAFSGCTSLQSVIFETGSQLQIIQTQTFMNCTSLTSINIPEGVMSIGGLEGGAFRNCSSLTSITIPASVTSIDDWAFKDCTGLTTVNIAEDSQLQHIGNWAFEDCTNLKTINFATGSQLKTINSWVFRNCTGITEITIPASVTSIGSDVFYGWTSSQTIYVEGYASEEASKYYGNGWGSSWLNGCNAIRKYWNGSEWV